MIQVELREGGEPKMYALSDAVGSALATSNFVDARKVGNEWEVFPRTKVGAARIGDVDVRVAPKINIRRILFMLGYARNAGWCQETVPFEQIQDLLPALAASFARQALWAISQGLLRGYVERESSMPVLRGRLRERDQIREQYGIALPLLVRYDDYTTDIAENQLLRAATERLLKLPMVDERSRRGLMRLRAQLVDAADVITTSALPAWMPNRLNERYQPALHLAEVILRDNALDQPVGAIHANGFLVDMAKVYEDFLTVAFTEAMRPYGGACVGQDLHRLDIGGRVEIRPDIVWRCNGEPAAVVDAKYKIDWSGGANADIYQMLAYCTALRLPVGHLVYAKGNAKGARHSIRNIDISVAVHTLDLDVEPAALINDVELLARRVAIQSETVN